MGCYCREQEQAGLYQWATAQLIITLGRADALLNTQDVIVSFVQGKNRLDLHKADLEIDEAANTITCNLTQEQTGAFDGSKSASVQVNLLYVGGERDASGVGTIALFSNLYEQVME